MPASGDNLTPAQRIVVNEDLRAEVVELRRQMEEIRARTASYRKGPMIAQPPTSSSPTGDLVTRREVKVPLHLMLA
jgi:hypothetical protein